jgi:hypothetical protein
MMNWFKKILQTLSLAALAGTSFLVPSALAQNADGLEAAIVDWYEKLNNEDPNYLFHSHDMRTIFP